MRLETNRWVGVLSAALVVAGCSFDPAGLGEPAIDGFVDADPDGGAFDSMPDTGWVDGGMSDGVADGDTPICEEGELSCEPDVTALVCEGGQWRELGECFLGCDEQEGVCRVPSNVNVESLPLDATPVEQVDFPEGATVIVDSDDGSIWNESEQSEIRPPVVGAVDSGIGFFRQSQPGQAPTLGIFVFGRVFVPATTVIRVVGNAAFVLLSTGDVLVEGVIDGGANGAQSGPGGYDGGPVGLPGEGMCPGQPGQSVLTCPKGCASGAGGGGLGGSGGVGGEVGCTISGVAVSLAGGLGGGPCATAELTPLVGGSGGGGGTPLQNVSSSSPGLGGGGGGAIQISSRGLIRIGAQGGILVPGGGGGQTTSGGGTGGGAGGAILLECDHLVVYTESFLAANGGGGGGGDCT